MPNLPTFCTLKAVCYLKRINDTRTGAEGCMPNFFLVKAKRGSMSACNMPAALLNHVDEERQSRRSSLVGKMPSTYLTASLSLSLFRVRPSTPSSSQRSLVRLSPTPIAAAAPRPLVSGAFLAASRSLTAKYASYHFPPPYQVEQSSLLFHANSCIWKRCSNNEQI